jgi:PAS domain S-box-containing protein
MNKATRVVLVDDDPEIIRVYSEILRLEGYEVWAASSGRRALQITRERLPDLVLLDVGLPDLDGIEVCRQIKADAALSDVFVILFSGDATSAARKVEGLAGGADEYIVKAVDPREFLARLRTISRLQNTTAALRASEERFRQLAENIREVFWMTDPAKNEMIYVSPGYEEIWGRTCESLYASARDWVDAVHPDDRERVLESALSKQISGHYDEVYRIVRADGLVRWIQDRAFPVRNRAGEVYRVVGIAEDITQRKQNEEALRQAPRRIIEAQEAERLRVARELHDGVNPIIASARMSLSMVQRNLNGQAPAARELLARSDRLLVQALEANHRIARNLHPSELDELGLMAACRVLCGEFRRRTNLAVRCNITRHSRRLPPALELNLFRISQEALANIQKHARAKSVQFRLCVQDNYLLLRILDDGRGFDAGLARTGNGKRHGLGLTNMRARAATLGGTCTIESAPKKGTTITVRVPRKQAKRGTGVQGKHERDVSCSNDAEFSVIGSARGFTG